MQQSTFLISRAYYGDNYKIARINEMKILLQLLEMTNAGNSQCLETYDYK